MTNLVKRLFGAFAVLLFALVGAACAGPPIDDGPGEEEPPVEVIEEGPPVEVIEEEPGDGDFVVVEIGDPEVPPFAEVN